MLGNLSIARKGSGDAATVGRFILNGLFSGDDPPPPPPEPSIPSGITLGFGVNQRLINNSDSDTESNIFTLPYGTNTLTFQCFGDSIGSVSLLGSVRGSVYHSLLNRTTAGITTMRSNIIFIKAIITTGTNVSVLVVAKRSRR